MSVFKIVPYIGYNNVKFSFDQEKVKEIEGIAPKIVIDNIMMEVYEHRNASVKLTYIDEKFVDIWIPQKPADNQVFISEEKELDLFTDGCLSILKAKYDFKESKDKKRILFPQLGICLWGFGEKRTKEGKMVIAFSEDRLSWYQTFINA